MEAGSSGDSQQVSSALAAIWTSPTPKTPQTPQKKQPQQSEEQHPKQVAEKFQCFRKSVGTEGAPPKKQMRVDTAEKPKEEEEKQEEEEKVLQQKEEEDKEVIQTPCKMGCGEVKELSKVWKVTTRGGSQYSRGEYWAGKSGLQCLPCLWARAKLDLTTDAKLHAAGQEAIHSIHNLRKEWTGWKSLPPS